MGQNTTKFCVHNLWASREQEMQNPTTQKIGGPKKRNCKLEKKMKTSRLGMLPANFAGGGEEKAILAMAGN